MSQCKDQHGSKKNQPRHQQITSAPSCRRSSQPCKHKRASGRTNQGKAGLRRSVKESAIFWVTLLRQKGQAGGHNRAAAKASDRCEKIQHSHVL